ncbi:MAG TPA: hybrid sensor histidine kinase/response regulator, partial [Desulfobulbaceae bacterium]|nr:hybrid sensor histidine kinase/response regulator [Desulfobulbaceae bacterium]
MSHPDETGQFRKKISILQQKVSLLETMVEDRTREAYLYQVELERYQTQLEELIEARTLSLQQAEARYRGLFENAIEGIYQTSPTGKILTCNPAFARMLGYDSPSAIINKVDDLAHDLYVNPADRDRLLRILHNKGKVHGFVARLRRQDGSVIWVESHCRLIQTADSAEPLIEGMSINISRRKEAEETLTTEKERLAVTLQSIGDGVICTDTEGRVTLLNLVTENLTGWNDDEARGLPLTEVFQIINEQTRQPVENPVIRVLREGMTIGLANHTILISRSGQEYAIADSAAPIRCHTGEILGVVLVFRDVTNQQRLEAEIQKIEKLESVGVLAGGIAHDF